MPIHGVDISRYQGPEAMNGYDFVIVNAEDPGFNGKINHAKALGIPWGPYTWMYPGRGANDMARAVQVCAPHGEPPLGYWLDYEQAGVSQGDIFAALSKAADMGVLHRTGIYTYLHEIGGVDLCGRPLWLAYYPRGNDGTYHPGQDYDARGWGAVMWQYTSGANAPVGLDKNVVIDETWYQFWTGGGDEDVDFNNMPLDQRIALTKIIKEAVEQVVDDKMAAGDIFEYGKFIQDQVSNAVKPV